MGVACLFGKHSWVGYKCSSCGKKENHKVVLTTLRTGAAAGDIKAIEKAMTAISVNARGLDGSTALIIATNKGQLDTIRMLMGVGADTELGDNQGQTPLIHAVIHGRVDVVEMLLAAGAMLDAKDRHGMTVLFHAAFHSNVPLVELLLKAGADVNVKDLSGMTPLMCAASKGDLETINLLLAAGADTTARNFEGTNAHSIAKHYLHTVAAALLKTSSPATSTLVSEPMPELVKQAQMLAQERATQINPAPPTPTPPASAEQAKPPAQEKKAELARTQRIA